MFLSYILPILLLNYCDCYALPVNTTPPSNGTALCWNRSTPVLVDSAQTKTPKPRTLFSVLWSCILTIIICAWSSVHPNLPPRSQQHALLRRIKLMFWTIVAPELVLAWAVRQWFAAREIKKTYNKSFRGIRPSKQWTMEHGHFVVMGGFTLVDEKIHQLEPEQPGWIATTADWNLYSEYVGEYERCQYGTLTLERFRELVDDHEVAFPAITTAQIMDRSKRDGLSKLIAILQTSWFIVQCVVRGFQGLAITELELVTLAMASLNAITFAFWWSKPLGVQEPVNVYVRQNRFKLARASVRSERHEGQTPSTAREVIQRSTINLYHAIEFILDPLQYTRKITYEMNVAAALGLYLVRLPYRLFFVLTWPVFILFPLGLIFLLRFLEPEPLPEPVGRTQKDETVATRVLLALRTLCYNLTYPIYQYFRTSVDFWRTSGTLFYHYYHRLFFVVSWFLVLPASFLLLVILLIFLSPIFILFSLASFIFTAVFEIVATIAVPYATTHVPSFYCPRTNSDRYSRMIVFAIFGVIFGGIHCIAWNFFFPTHSERGIWRYTSLVLTVIPLAAAPIDFLSENYKNMDKRVRMALDIFMTTLLFIYVPARLSLIAQALALLRDQPSTAYVAADWTKYIPHLFN